MLMLCMSVAFTSCGDDDEPVASIDDWYSECTSVSGGGWTPQECSQFMNSLNTDDDLELGPGYVWRNTEKEQAIYYFDRQMKTLNNLFGSGLRGVSGTLNIVFALKNSKGTTIKTTVLKVTSTSCSMS